MSDTLRQLNRLRVVNFEDCLLRSEGAVAIGDALRDGHECLEEVHLSHNELSLEAGMTVVNALLRKDSLKKLNLDGK